MNKFFLLFFGLFFLTGFYTHAQIYFDFNSSFRYLKGSEAGNLSGNWMLKDFNDSNWPAANAPFRYGDGNGGYELTDMRNNYSSLYLRTRFSVTNLSELKKLNLTINYDDGFILWINGNIALQQNAPDNPQYNSFATSGHESGTPENFNRDIEELNLHDGENQLAVQLFNLNLTSSDLFFDISLMAEIPQPVLLQTPDSLKVIFSHKGGFYTNNFSMKLSVPSNEFDLVYTVDGSNPQSSRTAIHGGKTSTIFIDPLLSTQRPLTPCFIVRASLVQNGLAPSIPSTQTYIFINQVIKQKHPGGNFPTGNVNGQQLNWEMDKDITENTQYKNEIDDALLAIPSISIVTDNEALFDPQTGIYVNALQHGIDWERLCSVELLNPDGTPGFNENAGLRIRGGWSRHNNYAKHAFRLFFRTEYGNSKLNYPLFQDEGVTEFDDIDLRTAQNYAWSNNQGHNTFVREVFSRDTQRDMAQPYTRSRYYHLYLNGMYWGLYQTQERSEASYAENYFGGQKDDYDVIKVNGDYSYNIEATDGNILKWQELWTACQTGFSSNKNYFILEGKDSNGTIQKNAEIKVDIDNLIDYMIIIFFTGNFDAPVSKFSNNVNPNNFYAIAKRDDKTKGFQFFAHDAEHSLLSDAVSPGIGITENRVSIPQLNVGSFSKFHPQWLHQKLAVNTEYRMRFADRVEKHFFNNGALTPANCKTRFSNRAKQIEMAIIAESARWGDGTNGNSPKTKNDDWQPEIEKVLNSYFNLRGDIVIQQLKAANLFPNIPAVEFTVNNKSISESKLNIDQQISVHISRTQSTGDIYLTTDGTDPRAIGGAVSGSARMVENPALFDIQETTWLKVRVKQGNQWSPLRKLLLVNEKEKFDGLKVTELNYHPADSIAKLDTIDGKSFEFIELKNTGNNPISLDGSFFQSGINYVFNENTTLIPQQFYVLASSSKWFFERYGLPPSGTFSGAFSNAGEQVSLFSKMNQEIFKFEYFDSSPWPTETDGNGFTLTATDENPKENPNNVQYWKVSTSFNGTPFYNDNGFTMDKSTVQFENLIGLLYPNPTNRYLNIKLMGTNEANIEVYTLTSQKVYFTTLTGDSSIDLEQLNLQCGMLLVKINNGLNQQIEKILYSK